MILLGQVEKINRNFIYKETAVKTIAVVRKVQVTNIYLCVVFFFSNFCNSVHKARVRTNKRL